MPFSRNANMPGWTGFPGKTPPAWDATDSQEADDPNYLKKTATPFPWRIRFSSAEGGKWNYRVIAIYHGSNGSTLMGSSTVESFTVNTKTPSGNMVIKVAEDGKYFQH